MIGDDDAGTPVWEGSATEPVSVPTFLLGLAWVAVRQVTGSRADKCNRIQSPAGMFAWHIETDDGQHCIAVALPDSDPIATRPYSRHYGYGLYVAKEESVPWCDLMLHLDWLLRDQAARSALVLPPDARPGYLRGYIHDMRAQLLLT